MPAFNAINDQLNGKPAQIFFWNMNACKYRGGELADFSVINADDRNIFRYHNAFFPKSLHDANCRNIIRAKNGGYLD